MKKITLILIAMTMSLFSFAQSQMSGTYTVGTGGSYDYSSMAEAGMAIKSAEFTGDVTLLICTDLTETINTGIVNKSEYTLTIRPDKDEDRTITYTTTEDNVGPTGVFVIGGDMTMTPSTTIGWASVPTKNVIVDGAAEGKTTPRLKITNEVFDTNVLLYGDVQNVVIKNCILIGRSSGTAYALVFRSENYANTSNDVAPKNCLVENCVLQSSSSSSQTVYFQGNQAHSVAGWPANITIRNSSIKARTRGLYVRQVNSLTIEGCTFDMSNSTSGILAHAIMGEGARGTINVKGNKFIKNSTANTYGGAYGLQTITASGGADVWVIENNYFAGYDALSSITNTTKGTEGILVAVRCGDPCVVRHNTFHMPKLTKTPASALVSAYPTALLWLAGSNDYLVQNNIFVCEETTANVSLIRGGLKTDVTGNVFYHKGGNAAIVAAAPSCMTFADLETSYPAQAATSKWTNVTFTDAANGDLSLAGSSDGDLNLAVDRLAEVLTDIKGTVRREKTYAGAYEGSEFPTEVCSVTTTVVPVDGGTVEGDGDYAKGASVTLTATSNDHYDFVNWTEAGAVVSTTAEYSFIVTKDIELTANFQEHAKYTITAVANDENMGTVTGGREYYIGESVTLKATAKSGYVFAGWADGEKNDTRTVTVSGNATYTANFQAIAPRAWAYDLKVAENGENYEFTFKATAAGSATLLFADIDGNELVAPHAVGTVAAGVKTVTLAKTTFEGVTKDVYWSVKMDGEAIPAISEITDQSRGIYDFYNMMGVVVDNNPDSKDFGKIYVQMALGGTTNDKAQTPGLFLFNQNLDVLNADPNVGIQPTLPSGYTLGDDRNKFHRLEIDPKTGNLAYCYNVSGSPAVFSIDRANPTGEVTNLIDGVTGLTQTCALCFDAEGTLYLMNLANSAGAIYKIVDGQAVAMFKPTGKFVNASMSLAADGKGGIWVAQNRGQIDAYYQLAHVTKDGVLDYTVFNGSNPDNLTGSSTRGALVYDAERQLLAQGRNGKVEVYSVTYNAETGVPALTLVATTPSVGTNIDGLAFDYAGDLYVVNSLNEKFYKFTLPTDENICTVPAPSSQKLVLGTQCEVTVTVNDPAMGSVEGAGQYEKGAEVILTPNPVAHHRFVNWTGDKTSTDNPLKFTIEGNVNLTANFAELPKYTITVNVNDNAMGSVTGGETVYVGESVTLTATPNPGHAFVKWDDGNTEATRTVMVEGNKTYTAIFQAIVPRAWTYDLRLVEEGDNYKFTFKATSAGDATLLFTNEAGTPVAPTSYSVGAVEAGEKSVTLAKSQFGGTEDIYWSVQMDGAAIENMIEITDASGNYDFFMPQDVKVDNSPNSMYFGQIYVAAAQDGACRGGNQKRGIFVYNQILEELNTSNEGYLPANATLTDATRHAIHRLAVNPINGYVAFAYNVSGSSAVWSMNPADMSGNAVNLIDNSITAANSICFDEDGALYVLNNANTSTGGNIYKILNGTAGVFANAQNGCTWGNTDNALAPDGRGGLWIAQNRWQLDGYPVLSHVDKDGIVDFAVTSSSPEALKALFPYDDNNASYRGQCAYYAAEDILAFGGNKEAVLFKVTYDTNNVPTNLEKLMSTGKLGTHIDGLAFDYAGDLYVASETSKRFYKFVVPTNTNTCTVPAPKSQVIQKETKYTVTVVANPAEGGIVSVSDGGNAVEGATLEVTATANTGYRFVNWTKNAEEISTSASFEYTVPAEDVTLIANFAPLPVITYELNGGVWNQFGWTSKKDMYNALLDDWRAYSGSTRPNVSYEEQRGIGHSSKGIPTTITSAGDRLALMELFTDATYATKWGWLATYVDAVAATQYKKMDVVQGVKTQPTSAAGVFTFTIGNFFGEDNAHSTDYIDAVDFTGAEAHITAFAPYWGQTFPMPIHPTEEVVLNAPYREGYEFDGWYTTSDFSGAAVTTVDENTDGTLYAKWIETIITVTIGEDVDNTTTLAPYVGKKVTATVTRNFGANKILTITLPFDMSASQISTHFGNATVYEFYNVVDAGEELHLQFTHTNSIEAGKPYILQTTCGYDAEDGFTIENVTINTERTQVKIGDLTMVPVLDGGGTLNQPTQYYLSNNALYCAGEYEQLLPGLRAFFTSASSTPIRARVIFDDNGATSIPTVIAPETKAQKIIQDGRLIIIHGEHQYNAQGQMME